VKVGEGNYEKGSGILTGFLPNGKKIRVVHYKNNLKHGDELIFNEDGTIKDTITYRFGKVVKTAE
ncbi:MAG TPA: hypothetical protein PKI35_00570, partial [Bacteroidales bacterium]|nr:hypothetical protein [Bacteroidales bacterium]